MAQTSFEIHPLEVVVEVEALEVEEQMQVVVEADEADEEHLEEYW